jgi:hypothetical protein
MAKHTQQSPSKQSRRASIEREVRRREEALAVPPDRHVFVFQEHFCDQGGPRGFWTKDYRDVAGTDNFDFQAWRARVKSGPEGWVAPEVVCQDDPDFPTQNGPGDFGEFHDLMIFSARAVQSLQHLLEPCGTFLPVRSELGAYVGFRLDSVLDALDLDRTRASWWLRPGHDKKESALSIEGYAFHTAKLGSVPIFRVPQHYDILVLKPFVEVVRANSLTGFRFCRVWPTSMAGLWWQQKQNWC